jgi:hypothetical protein
MCPDRGLVTLGLAATASASAPVNFTTTLFYDDSGNLTKEIRHVEFTGTLYRSDDLSTSRPTRSRAPV